MTEYETVKKELVTSPFLVDSVIDNVCNAISLVDTGCNVFGVITAKHVRRHKLHRVPTKPRDVYTYDDRPAERVEAVVRSTVDVGGVRTSAFLYEVSRMTDQDIILGLPWMERNHVVVDVAEKKLTFKGYDVTVNAVLPNSHIAMISATGFKYWKTKTQEPKRKERIDIFAVSMADIDKALAPKQHGDPRKLLPPQYHQYLDLFNRENADKQPPYRGKGIDHGIELQRTPDGKEAEIPYGPLYSQSREKLLVLRKTLNEPLDENFTPHKQFSRRGSDIVCQETGWRIALLWIIGP